MCMYDRLEGKWLGTHASNAAVRSDFYTVDLVNEGASDEVEKALGLIEGRMAKALAHIDEGIWPPDEDDQRAIADFIGLQSVRGTECRDSIQHFYDQVGQKMADLVAATGAGLRRAFGEEHGRSPTNEELENLKKGVAHLEVHMEIPRNYHIVLMLEMAGEQALVVYAKRLHILETETKSNFMTADMPLALWTATPGPSGAVSVMMADEVCLPLDRKRCLLLNQPSSSTERGCETVVKVDAARVAEINRRVLHQSHRFNFCHPHDFDAVSRLL